MKKLLLILLCLPLIGFGQNTYVPDDNFEQELINLGYDNVLDDYVITANIDVIYSLDVNYSYISDLTGIEDFLALTYLVCHGNQLTSLDVSNNLALVDLKCDGNQLTSLDVSNNLALIDLYCHSNQLTSLDVSGATALIDLKCDGNQLTSLDLSNNLALNNLNCGYNQLTSLDVSNNTALFSLGCGSNQLTTLDVRNGSNNYIYDFYAGANPDLECISVDDPVWSAANWGGNSASTYYYWTNCSSTSSIQEHTTNKELLKVTDLLGRETKQTNQPLFYIYDDGTVEKRIVIE